MPNKTIDALVFCPFYVTESKQSITCEGLISPQAVNKFTTEDAKKLHEYDFCVSKSCCGCPHYCALIDKYSQTHMRH